MNQSTNLFARSTGIVLTAFLAACTVVPMQRGGQETTSIPSQGMETSDDTQSTGTAAVLLPNVHTATQEPPETSGFDGERAYDDVLTQVEFGPRLPETPAHAAFVDWATAEFQAAGWKVEVREAEIMAHTARNIIATRPEADGLPVVVLGAHYDSRLIADKDPNPANHTEPVLGANDGSSGVAVLLEIARVLPEVSADIELVLFDLEDNGGIEGWDWILGSTAYVDGLEVTPELAVVVDMVGDADLNLYQERTSDPALTAEIWAAASELGYSQFIDEYKYSIIDDHTPFLRAGIPAVDIIDFDYPYHHTVSDTADKVSAESLKAVGDVLIEWLVSRYP